jgi:hypothetical protein
MTLLLALLTHRYVILASDRRVTVSSTTGSLCHFENATKQILINNSMAIAYCGVADLQRSWEKPKYNPELDTFHRPDHFLFRELPVTRDPMSAYSTFHEVMQRRWIYEADHGLCYVSVFFGATPDVPHMPRFLPGICTISNFLDKDLQQASCRHEFSTGLKILSPSTPFTFRVFGPKPLPEVIQATARRLAKQVHDPNLAAREILRSFATHLKTDNSNQNVTVSYIPHPQLAAPFLAYSGDFGKTTSFMFYVDGSPSHLIDQVLIRVGGNNLNLKDVTFEHIPVNLVEIRNGPRPCRHLFDPDQRL